MSNLIRQFIEKSCTVVTLTLATLVININSNHNNHNKEYKYNVKNSFIRYIYNAKRVCYV